MHSLIPKFRIKNEVYVVLIPCDFCELKLFREIFGKYKNRVFKKAVFISRCSYSYTGLPVFQSNNSNLISQCFGIKKMSEKESLIRFNCQQSSWFIKI